MSKGGGDQTTTTSSEPWEPLQGPLQQLIGRATSLSNQPLQYYPGQTYVGALPEETQAYQQQLDFANQVFGGGAAPDYAAGVAANNSLLGGGAAGALSGALSPAALQATLAQFQGGPNVQIGDYGSFSPQFSTPGLNPGAFTPNVSPTVTADPNAAIQQMLSATPDYSGVAGAVKAYADPVLDVLNQQILPGLESRGIALNNPTGEIKEANRIIPAVMRDISNQGAQLAEGERQRALAAQQTGAQLATSAGLTQSGQQLQAAGLGGQLAGTQAGLDQATQQLLAQYGLAGQQLGLQSDVAQQSALDQYRGDVLGLLGTTGELGQAAASNQATGVSQLPGLTQLGLTPGSLQGQYGQYLRGLDEAQLQDAMNRFNFEQQAPRDSVNWLAGILGGAGQGYGTQTQVAQQPDTNPLLSLLGTAATVGSMIPGPWTPLSKGVTGGLGAAGATPTGAYGGYV